MNTTDKCRRCGNEIDQNWKKKIRQCKACLRRWVDPLMATHNNIKQRCNKPHHKQYKDYGARGITLDPALESFQDFKDYIETELGPKPTPSHSLDRIDVNGNYAPGNLRWADSYVQAQNKRINPDRICKYRGVTYDSHGRNKPYKAQLAIQGKTKHLGYFKYEESAAIAYDKAARKYNQELGTKFALNYKWSN